jgi:hypothetical protein
MRTNSHVLKRILLVVLAALLLGLALNTAKAMESRKISRGVKTRIYFESAIQREEIMFFRIP